MTSAFPADIVGTGVARAMQPDSSSCQNKSRETTTGYRPPVTCEHENGNKVQQFNIKPIEEDIIEVEDVYFGNKGERNSKKLNFSSVGKKHSVKSRLKRHI